jgi:hypothetical protein
VGQKARCLPLVEGPPNVYRTDCRFQVSMNVDVDGLQSVSYDVSPYVSDEMAARRLWFSSHQISTSSEKRYLLLERYVHRCRHSLSDLNCVVPYVHIGHDLLILPPHSPPANDRKRNCMDVYTHWSKIRSDQK